MPELEVAPNAADAVSPPPVADPIQQDSPADGQPAPDAPFLTIDDRTSYKTREDAIKGWQDTKQRAIELSPWGDFSNRYQVKTPAEMEEILAEYMELKRQAEAAQAAPKPVAGNEYEKLSDTDIMTRAQAGDAQANAEWERRWVAQQAEKAGYVKKDYVDGRFKEFQTSRSEEQAEARRTSALTNGASILGELLGKDNADLLDEAHSSIENWILKSSRDAKGELIRDSLEDQFFQSAEARRKVLEQGVQNFLKKLDGYVAKKTAATSSQKEKAIAAAPKPLPAGNTSAPPAANKGKRMDFDDPDFKREVREMFVK